MAKKKNPNRVKAGKKAWAKMKREGRGLAGMSQKKKSRTTTTGTKSSGGGRVTKKKLPSLAKSVTVVGGVITITGIGADATNGLIGDLQSMVDVAGLGLAVTGASIIFIVNFLKALSSFWPWFGRKYRGWLRGYGFRP